MGEPTEYVLNRHIDDYFTEDRPSRLILWIVFAWVVAIAVVVLMVVL